ncbi:hypothetical protein QVD17_08110 [Tagetes erecta]|uniref:Tf2-1-like SH3-like domain-containing protein n=1 Tax=Tagetes erecta TaxID=13708 RepID=A0AAD8KZ59_TARER|nr:hypothetical protein QVD17_08110 [Tagetes erecta]
MNTGRRKVFFKGDLVCVQLSKERFPHGRFCILKPHADGPFHVLNRINDNAYKINLPGHYTMSSTVNVSVVAPFVEGDEFDFDSRTSAFQVGDNDTDPEPNPDLTTHDPTHDPFAAA